jgi:hypothetical protein
MYIKFNFTVLQTKMCRDQVPGNAPETSFHIWVVLPGYGCVLLTNLQTLYALGLFTMRNVQYACENF